MTKRAHWLISGLMGLLTSGAMAQDGLIGACCFAELGCMDMPAEYCEAAGGDWQGAGVGCGDVNCGMPTHGACCVNGGCVMLMPEQCASIMGQWSEGACNNVECAPYCSGDVDGDGIVGVGDILEVLAQWGPCI